MQNCIFNSPYIIKKTSTLVEYIIFKCQNSGETILDVINTNKSV